ncbi:helix-turn-helix domain-containing protein, partial [Escherichia coli]|nr:helix-turn-helix domain-containing protein [Escherichia coli]
MEKFSLEFKKVVSEKYLEGELSLKSVARMYGISPCTVRKWAYAYREHGISILTGKKGRYSAELKRKRLVRTVLIFTESSDQLSRATDRVPGLPAS